MAIGPLVGGVLVEASGWEAIFFVNLPIGIAAIALTLTRVAESRDPHGEPLDWAGTITFSAALFLAVFALIRGNAEDWSAADPRLPGRRRRAARGLRGDRAARAPADPRPLAVPQAGLLRRLVAAFVLSASMFAMFLYLTLYVQNILGYGALEAGLRFLPITLVSFAVAPISGKFAEQLGPRWFLAGGLALVGIGLLLMSGVDPGDDWTALLAGFLVAGGGIGLTNPALATAAIGVVEPRRSGMASGINSTFRQVGIATGIAAWGAIFQHVVADEFNRRRAAGGGRRRRRRRLRRRHPSGRSGRPARRAGLRHRAGPHPAARRHPRLRGRRRVRGAGPAR